MLLCKELQVTLQAGIDFRSSIENAQESVDSSKLRRALQVVRESVDAGHGPSEAFEATGFFNAFFIGVVAAGERSGELPFVFGRLSDHYRRRILFRAQFKKLFYPFFITLFTSGFVFYAGAFFYYFFTENMLGVPPYMHQRLLVSGYSFAYWLALAFLIMAYFAGKFFHKRSQKTAWVIDYFLLCLPVAGSILRSLDMARFSLFFSMLYHCGIPITEAVEAASKVVNNTVMRDEIAYLGEHLQQNLPLEAALESARYCDDAVLRAFRIGANTGNFEEPMQEANRICREKAEDAVDAFVNLMKPLLMIFAAVMLLANAGIFQSLPVLPQ
jgi:type IV pilus assembly protein PilC